MRQGAKFAAIEYSRFSDLYKVITHIRSNNKSTHLTAILSNSNAKHSALILADNRGERVLIKKQSEKAVRAALIILPLVPPQQTALRQVVVPYHCG